MKILEDEIAKRGKVLPGDVLKVGDFVNHKMEVPLLSQMADEVYNHFKDKGITTVLTVEASGIALAILVAERLGVSMSFAKKSKALNADGDVYSAECYSYTRQNTNLIILPKDYLLSSDKVLIVDDFLAVGNATNALRSIVSQAKAQLVGVAIAVEKGFQGGGDKIREEGIDLLSLAVVDSMENGKLVFRK